MDVKLERKRILNNIYLKLNFIENELEELFIKVRLIYEKKNIVEEVLDNKKEKIKTKESGNINNKQKKENIKVIKKTRKVAKNEYVMPEPKIKLKKRTKKKQRICRSVLVLDTSSEDLSDSD